MTMKYLLILDAKIDMGPLLVSWRKNLFHFNLETVKILMCNIPSIFLTLCISKSLEGAGAGDSSSAEGGGSTGGSPSSSSKYQSYCQHKLIAFIMCY